MSNLNSAGQFRTYMDYGLDKEAKQLTTQLVRSIKDFAYDLRGDKIYSLAIYK